MEGRDKEKQLLLAKSHVRDRAGTRPPGPLTPGASSLNHAAPTTTPRPQPLPEKGIEAGCMFIQTSCHRSILRGAL